MPSILILEDEPAIAESLEFVLTQEGFNCHWESRGERALTYVNDHRPDLAILDVGLPDMSGFEVCKSIRQVSTLPVIFLTARSDEIDRIVGLEIGADDYVVKPFSPREVAARVKAIFRRTQTEAVTGSGNTLSAIKSVGKFDLNPDRLEICFQGTLLNLTPMEYRLLGTLLDSPDKVHARETLLESLGIAVNAGYERTIDTHIKAIRQKIKAVDSHADPIVTQRGFGYRLNPGS